MSEAGFGLRVLNEGEVEINGHIVGAVYESDTPYGIAQGGDETGAMAVRHQDVVNPRADMIHFGRDYLTPAIRNFILCINTEDQTAIPRLRAIWRADHVRFTPGKASTIRWKYGGITYRAYGRGREFEVLGKDFYNPNWHIVHASWQYNTTEVYRDEPHSVTLGQYTQSTSSCLILPHCVLPTRLGSGQTELAGVVTAQATSVSPFVLTVTGPIQGKANSLRIWGEGWLISFPDVQLKPLDKLVIDTRAGTATLNGINVAGQLSHDSTLLGRIKEGPNTFHMTINDPTSTVRAEVVWHDALTI